jgi:hypothetical protein
MIAFLTNVLFPVSVVLFHTTTALSVRWRGSSQKDMNDTSIQCLIVHFLDKGLCRVVIFEDNVGTSCGLTVFI